MTKSSLGMILGIGIVFYLLILLAVVPAINRKRHEDEIAKFGQPKYSPLKAGVMNLIPGFGLWYLGEPIRVIAINAVLFFVVLAFALFWRSWPLGSMTSRVSIVIQSMALSGLYAESLAQRRWRTDAQG